MGYTLPPTQTRIPIPRPPLPVDRFPSFIVITSPSVIVTTLTVRASSRNGAGLAHREPRRFLTNPDFWNEFTAKAVDLVFGAALHGLFTPAALPADEMRDDTLGILDEFDRCHAHAREKRSL
jgi:hypothetical protein